MNADITGVDINITFVLLVLFDIAVVFPLVGFKKSVSLFFSRMLASLGLNKVTKSFDYLSSVDGIFIFALIALSMLL